jgi:hypothetical protein
MTTNGTIPAPPADRAGRASRWRPRSTTAWAILGLSALATWPAAFFVAATGFMIYPGCFDDCGSHGAAYTHYAVAAVAVLTPFAAVRIHQAEQSAPETGRTLAACGLVAIVTVLAWWLWEFAW